MDRLELRQKLSKQYEGDQQGFLVAEAKALMLGGRIMDLTQDHFDAVASDFSSRKKALINNFKQAAF